MQTEKYTLELPILGDTRAVVAWIAEHIAPAALTAEIVRKASYRLDRDHYPALVRDLDARVGLPTSVLAEVLPDAWSMAEFPQRCIPEQDWRALFGAAGFTVDGRPAERPTRPVRLYRGASRAHRAGWSWTDDSDLAAWFKDRYPSHDDRCVWTALVPPEWMFAQMTGRTEIGRETEYVIDTTHHLHIERAKSAGEVVP